MKYTGFIQWDDYSEIGNDELGPLRATVPGWGRCADTPEGTRPAVPWPGTDLGRVAQWPVARGALSFWGVLFRGGKGHGAFK